MNAVVVAVAAVVILSLLRVHVVIALIISALAGGLIAGMDLATTLKVFNQGLGNGAGVALSYALLGAFAVAIARSGVTHWLTRLTHQQMLGGQQQQKSYLKWGLLAGLTLIAVSSQNILPIHIAFIPLLLPPLLLILNELKLDRRAVACVLTFGLITPYMLLPVGFGGIYLNEILLKNLADNQLPTEHIQVMSAMAIPALGMLGGLLIAVFVTYRQPRHYNLQQTQQVEQSEQTYSRKSLLVAACAIASAFIMQLLLGSMLLGALVGFVIFSCSKTIEWRKTEGLFTDGMKMMASIGFIMIAASGYAEVMRESGQIETLVSSVAAVIGDSKALGALLMLSVGLIITLGVGSSFSTVPIIAAIFVPLALQLGFSPMAIACLVGTAGALGDAGSPASDSTLGPTAGLNADGQHSHIWDTVVPTFIHYNIPLLICGWLAAMVL